MKILLFLKIYRFFENLAKQLSLLIRESPNRVQELAIFAFLSQNLSAIPFDHGHFSRHNLVFLGYAPHK